MTKLLRFAAVAGLTMLLSGTAWAGEVLDRVTSSGVLKVSTDPAYPPQSFQKADGSFDGFDIEVAKEIAKRLNAEVEWVPQPGRSSRLVVGAAAGTSPSAP